MKKTLSLFLLFVILLCLNDITSADTPNYQLIGKISDCTVYFDTQTVKIVHVDEINQDCIDVWVKVVRDGEEWKEEHAAIMKKIGIWKEGYNDLTYRTIHYQYRNNGKMRKIMFIDYTSKDEALNSYSLSPMPWEKPNDDIEKTIYQTIKKYVDDNMETIKERQ